MGKRLQVWLTGHHALKKVVLKTNIGPVVSTAGIDQIHVLAALQSEIPFEKFKALVGKNARVPRSWWTHLDKDCILDWWHGTGVPTVKKALQRLLAARTGG